MLIVGSVLQTSNIDYLGTNWNIVFKVSTQSEHGISFVGLRGNCKPVPPSLYNGGQIETTNCQNNRLPYWAETVNDQ